MMMTADEDGGHQASQQRFKLAAVHEGSVTQRVMDYIEVNYADQISLRHVAQAVGYSACHLTTTFRRATGTPVTAWIIKRRIMAAQKLLAEENVDVATACEAVGFSDLCYFTRQFVRQVGITPGRFRVAMKAARSEQLSGISSTPERAILSARPASSARRTPSFPCRTRRRGR